MAIGRWERAHSLPEEEFDQLRETAQENLGRVVAELNLQFNLFLPEGVDPGATIDALNVLDCVEIALPVPIPVPAPLPPDYQPNQGYLNAATSAGNARYDYDCNGLIATTDFGLVKPRFGNMAPACP